MDLNTSLSSINFNSLVGGNSEFGLNQKTGNATLGFGAKVAFFSKFLTVICCMFFGIYTGVHAEKDSKRFTKKSIAQFFKINCKESKVAKTEKTGKRSSETRLETSYECSEEFRYKVGEKLYKSKIDKTYPHNKSKELQEEKNKLEGKNNKSSQKPNKLEDDKDNLVDFGEKNFYEEKEIYYDPDKPDEYSLIKIEKGTGIQIILGTLCCGICCLIFLYYCYKDIGCRGFMAFNFFADTMRGDNDSDDIGSNAANLLF